MDTRTCLFRTDKCIQLGHANHCKFQESVEITDPRGEGWIWQIHRSEDLNETKMPEDLVKQTWFQRFVGEEFMSVLQPHGLNYSCVIRWSLLGT